MNLTQVPIANSFDPNNDYVLAVVGGVVSRVDPAIAFLGDDFGIVKDGSIAVTVSASHNRKALHMTSSAANTVTIQPYSVVPLPVGFRFVITQKGSGLTTVAAGTAAVNLFGSATSRGQNFGLSIYQYEQDKWQIIGGA